MSILITGSTGFIGSNLIRYLKTHHPASRIFTLGRSQSDYTWDELVPDTLKGIDAIIHLAGKAHDTSNSGNPQEYFDVNFELTKSLYDLYLQSDASVFIYMSSVKAVADSTDGILTEDRAPDPLTPYGRSKQMAEQYIIEAGNAVKDRNSSPVRKNYYILRPCMVHGPGNKGNLNLLYQFASRGVPYPLAAFGNSRSFLSIDNLCFVIQRLLASPVPSGIFQVADDEPLATTELITLIAKVQRRSPRLWSVPRGIITFAARAGDLLRLPLNSERLKKLTENYIVSNHRIKEALGIDRMPTDAREGLIQTLETFK